MADMTTNDPLVSVIIPCYNHAHYLQNAIASVKDQSYSNIEIVVVDDGSSDNTKEVAENFHGVKYIFQKNMGLSASRNTGIDRSLGEYLIFLDADDVLYPDAVRTNVNYLKLMPELAFVSGAHDKWYAESNFKEEKITYVKADHYVNLLQGNYIAMIAAVLFQRWAFRHVRYDTTLRACEDYDVYLNIAGRYPVVHHTEKIAVYNIYQDNMSSNIPLMLRSALKVLGRQKKYLTKIEEEEAFAKGQEVWKKYFCGELLRKLESGKTKLSSQAITTLLEYRPWALLKYVAKTFYK